MGRTRYRVTDVAETLGHYIKADLAEDLSLAMIGRQFPGISRDQLRRALALCKDEVARDYERSQELVASMRATTAGHAALLALLELWRSQSNEQRRAIGRANPEFAGTMDKLQTTPSSKYGGWELLATLTNQRPH